MGSMWIFLLFAGIAVLLKGKGVAQEQTSAPQGAPTSEEREDIERRIRGIMGVPQAEKRVVPPVASPMEQAQPTTTSMLPSQPQPSLRQVSQFSEAYASSKKAKVIAPKSKPIVANATAPQSITANPQSEAVMEDFSLEKAVIYAEILQPKFKEY